LIIDSVYLLLPDGRCIYSKSYKTESITDPHLLGGLLNAFNIASHQWLKDGVRKFVSEEGLNFVIKDFASFLVVISGILKDSEEYILDKIGMKFLSKYGNQIEKWKNGNIGILRNFDSDLIKILELDQQDDYSKNVTRMISKDDLYLDSLTIINLPSIQQKTALAMLSLKNCTAEEISIETHRSIELEIENLESLVQQGYLYKKIFNTGKIHYYIP